ncbi:MAG: glycosyl transferase [Solirubrobacterales bacterium]
MREYCTHMDSVYLEKGIALHRSLLEHGGDFRLHVVCFDELSERVLRRLDMPRMELAGLAELEAYDPELAAVRDERSKVEYLWTSTPCVTRFFRDRAGLDEITYIDADIRFLSSPEPLFEEMGDASVLITPASSSPQHYSKHLAKMAGLFVVQFIPFRSDERGSEALEWWRERCIEYCSADYGDGRMGDQKYLDDWPTRFQGVHVLAHPGGLGPWNIESRRVEDSPAGMTVDGEPLVFFHYMGLQTFATGSPRLASGRFRISAEERRLIYEPHLAELERIRAEAVAAEPDFAAVQKPRRPAALAFRQAVSRVIGVGARARIRIAPHWNVGPYVSGGYVPEGYEASVAAVEATYSTSASESSG